MSSMTASTLSAVKNEEMVQDHVSVVAVEGDSILANLVSRIYSIRERDPQRKERTAGLDPKRPVIASPAGASYPSSEPSDCSLRTSDGVIPLPMAAPKASAAAPTVSAMSIPQLP